MRDNYTHHMDDDVKTFFKGLTWAVALGSVIVGGIFTLTEYDDHLTNQHQQQFISQCVKLGGQAQITGDNEQCLSGTRILISNNQNVNN